MFFRGTDIVIHEIPCIHHNSLYTFIILHVRIGGIESPVTDRLANVFDITTQLKVIFLLVIWENESTRLLFAQNLTAAMTDDGNSLIEMLFDVFEKDLIDMLELSDATRKAIEGVE